MSDFSWTPKPSDYSPPQNGPLVAEAAQVSPYPPDGPTVDGALLTMNVFQRGAG